MIQELNIRKATFQVQMAQPLEDKSELGAAEEFTDKGQRKEHVMQ